MSPVPSLAGAGATLSGRPSVSRGGGTGLHFQILTWNPAALSVPSVVETETGDTGDGDTEEPDEGRKMG